MLESEFFSSNENSLFCDQFAIAPLTELEPNQTSEHTPKVLILEDDAVQLQLLVQHLDSFGMKIDSATTIADAKQKLSETAFDLGIFDIQLPDGSGLDLCATIDDDPGMMGLPVVVLSSVPNENVVRRTRSAGGCYFIGKPYDPNVLITIIERALGYDL